LPPDPDIAVRLSATEPDGVRFNGLTDGQPDGTFAR
jgi:hypothetical protein